jgi:hypothetical protein
MNDETPIYSSTAKPGIWKHGIWKLGSIGNTILVIRLHVSSNMLTLLDILESFALLLKLETVFQSIFVFPDSRFHCNNIYEFFTLPQDYPGVYKMPFAYGFVSPS